jgi:hypothetical protein
MEFGQEEKERIVAEEKLRMETRKEYFKENFGGMGWGHRWGGHWHGCHGRCGGGFLKALVLILVIAALFHFWHGAPCGPCGYYPPAAQYQAPPAGAPQAPEKN